MALGGKGRKICSHSDPKMVPMPASEPLRIKIHFQEHNALNTRGLWAQLLVTIVSYNTPKTSEKMPLLKDYLYTQTYVGACTPSTHTHPSHAGEQTSQVLWPVRTSVLSQLLLGAPVPTSSKGT